jgi:polyhydroxybutyrate depolymerase
MRLLLCFAAALSFGLFVAACGGDDDGGPADTGIDPSLNDPSQPTPEEALTPEPTRPGRLPTPSSPVASPTPRPTPIVQPLGTAGCGNAFKAGDSVQTIDSYGGKRSYRLHVPPSYDPVAPWPVVLSFHGYSQSAEQQERYSGLNPLANQKGFIVVTPDGSSSPKGWNIVGVYDENGVDDVAFVRQLMAGLSTQLCVDQNRIFATGHSNGGEMAAQLACAAPDLIASAAPVSGAVWQGCPGRPVPIVTFQGTADKNVLYEWSSAAMNAWGQHNGCSGTPAVAKVSAHVSRKNWQKCKADTVLYAIDGGGHTWPGSKVAGGAGPVTQEINASNLIWSFFAAHPKK